MDCSNSFFKPDKIDLAFVVFILFIMLCNVTFCSESLENVDVIIAGSLSINANRNYFLNDSTGITKYFKMDRGYIYHITLNANGAVALATSSDAPKEFGLYNYLGILEGNGNSFDYLCIDDSFLYFDIFPNYSVTVTKERIQDMSGVVNILSHDVGTNQFWNIFVLSIPFILVVVIVVFGFFIIRRLTKKESKGDIRF